MKQPPPEFDLTPKQKKLFFLILGSGPKGVSPDEIMSTMYKGKSPVSLRTAIHYINKAVHPLQIRLRPYSNAYRIINKNQDKPRS